ncbi:MAG: histidine phosphatase family protein [Parasporobacterium sp.]|nr:histidine phosphatase family protein [Parasporobacterium sp.]
MRNWAENQIEIVLIRHGQTPSNKFRKFLGSTDEPLSEEGVELIKKKVEKKAYPSVDYIFASPMKRCLETKELIYPGQDFEIIDDLRETDFGEYECMSHDELKDKAPYIAWMESGGEIAFPGGESRSDFAKRVLAGFDEALNMLYQKMEKDKVGDKKLKVAFAVHGGIIMALLASYYGGEYYDYLLQNGEGYELTLSKEGDKIKFKNPKKIGVL